VSGVSQWLLSITGVVLLSVLAEFVLPEGQINKYTKVIFSFVVLLVVIMPLPKLFGKDIDISHFFSVAKVFCKKII
jgi:stage III sporulation protein AF